jgi:leader peptidase (prepilin peptidase)/N-methyltransferase
LPVIFGAVAGLLAGSFIATFAIRWPRGESALAGRSRCDHCGATIEFSGLVPILSYAAQRGRARCCGARIDPLHPAVEAAAALIGAISALLPCQPAIAAAVLGWTLLALGLIDLRAFRLPNPAVALLAVSGFAAALWLRTPSPTDSLIGAVAGFASLEAVRLAYRRLRNREGIGAGDPKMFAAIGAWVGWEQLPLLLLIASLAGLLWAIAGRLAGRRLDWSDRMPLGTLLAIASWPVWLWSVAAAALR